jgi:16S rRNA (uracil1498-N3)-methyltransferase
VTPRFHAPQLDPGTDLVTLSEDESHHLAHVMRLEPGATVRVFDGRGREWVGRVTRIGGGRATVQLSEPVEPAAREPTLRVTLAQAVLKGDRMDAVVRDATMMGVAAIQPLSTAHTAVVSRRLSDPRLRERWQRIAVSSAKQCGRAVVPVVTTPVAFGAFVGGGLPGLRLLLVEPRTGVAAVSTRDAAVGDVVLTIGPEGGWSVDEVRAAGEAGFLPWSLGGLTLRADAVPVAALAILAHVWESGRGGRAGVPGAGV